jgi:hypothetical protein
VKQLIISYSTGFLIIFLEECSAPDEEDICFEAKNPFAEYRLDSISQNLKEIQWPSENERQNFLSLEDNACGLDASKI